MIPQRTLAVVSEALAYHRFMEWCDQLESIMGKAFEGSFKDERIGIERQKRIFDKFMNGITEESRRFKYGHKVGQDKAAI